MKVVLVTVRGTLVVLYFQHTYERAQTVDHISSISGLTLPEVSPLSTFASTLQATKHKLTWGSDKLRGFGSLLAVKHACLHGRIPQNHRHVPDSQ